MKNRTRNIFRFYILLELTVTLAFAEGNVFAQAKWLPTLTEVFVPVNVRYYYSSRDYGLVYDSSHDGKSCICLSTKLFPKLLSYFELNDSVSISYGDPDYQSFAPYYDAANIHFIVDKVNKRLRNFYIGYTHKEYYYPPENQQNDYSTHYHVQFSSLEYSLGGTINSKGDSCRKKINSSDYQYSFKRITHAKDGSYIQGEDRTFISLDNSFLDNFEVTCFLSEPINSVLQLNGDQENLRAIIYFSDHTIHFSFPASSHSQTMPIYDILGREISKIEIPVGSTSYVLQSAGYPKGTYFARLGNSSSHFEMY